MHMVFIYEFCSSPVCSQNVWCISSQDRIIYNNIIIIMMCIWYYTRMHCLNEVALTCINFRHVYYSLPYVYKFAQDIFSQISCAWGFSGFYFLKAPLCLKILRRFYHCSTCTAARCAFTKWSVSCYCRFRESLLTLLGVLDISTILSTEVYMP